MKVENLPELAADERVVLFDGVCKLCNWWARLLIRHDSKRRHKLATLQSAAGKAVLARCGLPGDRCDTVVLVQGNKFFVRSTAVIKILTALPLPWKIAAVAWLIPRRLRDYIYDCIARNRYRLFGRYEACLLPTPEHLSRFLE